MKNLLKVLTFISLFAFQIKTAEMLDQSVLQDLQESLAEYITPWIKENLGNLGKEDKENFKKILVHYNLVIISENDLAIVPAAKQRLIEICYQQLSSRVRFLNRLLEQQNDTVKNLNQSLLGLIAECSKKFENIATCKSWVVSPILEYLETGKLKNVEKDINLWDEYSDVRQSLVNFQPTHPDLYPISQEA